MKRRILIVASIAVLISLNGCGIRETVQTTETEEKVSVEISSENGEQTIIPEEEKEKAPNAEIGNTTKITITSEKSKISEVLQDKYFEENGFSFYDGVEFCFTKLPDKTCSYEMFSPIGETFEVKISLENGEEYYFTLSREE